MTLPENPEELLRAAASLLLGDVPELARLCVREIRAQEPVYAGLPDGPTEEVHEVVTSALRARLERLAADGPGFEGALGRLRSIAVTRARQGIALDALLHAYAVCGTVLWQQLVDTVHARWPDRIPLMLPLARRMWDDRENGTETLADAYRETLGEEAVDRAARMRRLLALLVEGAADPLVLGGAATALGLPRSGRFAVAVTRGHSRLPGPAAPEPPLTTGSGMRLLRAPGEGGDTILAVLGPRPPDELDAVLRADGGVRAGIGPVVGSLAGLGRSTRLARAALATCTAPGEVARWRSRMPGGLVAAGQDLGGRLADHVLGTVLALPPEEHDGLLATLAAWLDHEGSPRRAAEHLGCHRNTVLNRLRRLEQLTDRRLARPRDVVELALALEAYRLRQR